MKFVDPEPARRDLYERELARLRAARADAPSPEDAKRLDREIRRAQVEYRVRRFVSTAHW
jgi:hypothetical protein